MFFYSFGDKGDAEPPYFIVVIRTAIAGEFNRSAHLFEDLEIVIEAAFRDADFGGAIGGCAGGF